MGEKEVRGEKRDREPGGERGWRGRCSIQAQSQSLLPLHLSPTPQP